MVHEILICLEGSPSGSRAVDVAITLAGELDAAIVGLAIVDEPDIRAAAATPIGGASYKAQRDEALVDDARERAKQWLDDFTLRCRAAEVLGLGMEVTGSPAATILREARRRDITILGRQANFRFETEDSDWQTRDAVLRGAGKPVVIVPESRADDAGPAVLVAYDGTPASVRALASFAGSGLARDRQVHVLSVGDEGTTAWELAEKGVARLGELGVAAQSHHVVSLQSTAEAILDVRQKLGAGMIVQGAYAHSRFKRMLWGSVTRDMLSQTVVPVFVHY
jgi:nucleotide-binding universal stress UspA family protein